MPFEFMVLIVEPDLSVVRPKMRMRNAYIWIAAIWSSSLIIVLPLSVVSEANNGICYENWPSINHRKAYTIALFILHDL